MSELPVQNYANHRTNDFKLIGAALGVLIAIALALVGAYVATFLVAIAVALMGICVAILGLRLRVYATRLQDRIIRLEMRVRLHEALDPDLRSRINELTVRQLVGLRFASDAELPALVRKVLDEKIQKSDDIKKLVKDWQADDLRV